MHLCCSQAHSGLYEIVCSNLLDALDSLSIDIIIDDCSHETELTIYSYVALRRLVNNPGLYIIEDCKAKRAKYTTEILGKYGEIRKAGRNELIIIKN